MATRLSQPTASENILKQGYLKKSVQTTDLIPSASKQFAHHIKQKLEPNRWYVFVVRNRIPFLEYYEKEESIFTGPPVESYNLSSFQSLSFTMGRTNTNFTFCIFLADRTVELTAPNRAHMLEWCRCIERTMRNLGLRSKHLKEDHQYTAFPVKSDYTPTRTSFDDPPSELVFEGHLLDNTDSHLDEEVEDHDYQDATTMKLDDKEETDNPTLPLRPPPRLPRRNKCSSPEEVFASLSTVRREDMYNNLDGFNHDVDHSEERLFGTDSDTDSDKSDKNEKDDTDGKRKSSEEKRNIIDNDDDDDDDRCTSLPIISTVPQESDTSEDSDFVSASFWLRNRRPENHTDNPPQVPERFDSVTRGPKPKPRNCISMNMDYLKPKRSPRPVSPALDLLGEAPVIPKRNYDEGALKFVNNNANGNVKPNDKVVVLDTNDWYSVNGNSSKNNKSSVTNSCDSSQSEDDGGLYETLVEKPKASPKVLEVNKTVNGKSEDDVYEATWQCSSARRINDDEDDDDDVCCNKEPEKLTVDMSDQKKVKSECNEKVEMRNADSQSHKKGGVFSKIFNRKSAKERELPDRLVVSIPVEDSQRSCGEGSQRSNVCSNETTQPTVEENLYSDFPSPGVEPKPNPLDSDILKLSLLENEKMASHSTSPTSPIELPRRDFAQHPIRTVAGESTKPKQNLSMSMQDPIQGFSQNAYEPVDLSKSVNLDYQSKRPPVPSPPVKTKFNKFSDKDSLPEQTPVAPPRRNRKSDKSSQESLSSPDSRRKSPCAVPPSVPAGSPPIPKRRQTVKDALSSSSREPALPPRNHHDNKPAVPPPPRRPVVLRAASDVSGGARPKTIHLASRQQSINQSSALTVMNLKQNQVDILKSEMESTGGLVKVISKVHFQSGLAIVECFSKLWIAGWDVKKFPRLYDKFHIGDQLISINDVQVTDLAFTHKLVKNVKAENIEISIRRLPNAKVFAIQRSAEGESLGIKREGGTAEIVYIDPQGLAYRHGLEHKPTTIDGNGLCNWMLTEVNMRPLNLFFKDSEIERRLLAVGRDISIAVQPSDFVKELKKQLKKLKGYKDYLIQ